MHQNNGLNITRRASRPNSSSSRLQGINKYIRINSRTNCRPSIARTISDNKTPANATLKTGRGNLYFPAGQSNKGSNKC